MNSNTNASANASGASATGVTAIDFRTLPDFIPSMCIPRVYPNISEGRIRKIFDELNIGVIDRVDIVSKATEKGEKFNRVFIHMDRWFHNSNASVARERLLGGKDIKIIYDDPWFWKVSAYKPGEASNNNNNNNNKKKATIQFDSSDDEKERRKPKVTDIKPLTEPRPRPYNNNNNNRGGCNKARREDTFQKEERPLQRPVVRVKEEKPIERPHKQEKPIIKEEINQRPILRDNNPKIEAPPPVQYDEAVIASTKKRVIIIRKEPKKEPV
jgi:hypothetical protein